MDHKWTWGKGPDEFVNRYLVSHVLSIHMKKANGWELEMGSWSHCLYLHPV
jgi:hypothetical protein